MIRLAEEKDLPRINELRKQVHAIHVTGRPEVFKPDFEELRDYIQELWKDRRRRILVEEEDGVIRGFAVLNHITTPEDHYMYERDYLNISEFGVDASSRRQGIASELISYIREYARNKGFGRIELNMWEFNQSALAFYEAAGFSTYRRYMEMKL